MAKQVILYFVSAGAALFVSLLVLLKPRFGQHSWLLVPFLVPAALVSASLGCSELVDGWSSDAGSRAALAFLLLAASGGLTFSVSLTRDRYLSALKRWRIVIAGSYLVTIGLAALYLNHAAAMELQRALGAVGRPEYLSGGLLLALSVLILANSERTLRSAEEHVRWEIKFLVLGVAAAFTSTVYLASKLLLYANAPRGSLQVFCVVLFPACILIWISWRRCSGRGAVVVSQGLAYSSITFLGVGLYLIASSVLARWAGRILSTELEAGVVIFLLSGVALATVLLSTSIRHRIRYWIRRNLYAGKYDYRELWVEATQRIRDSDPAEIAAEALADLVHRVLGALDITVWVRNVESGEFELLCARGSITVPSEEGIQELMAGVDGMGDVVSITDARREGVHLFRGLEKLRAVLAVPLRSGRELVGLLTVGSDRSGRDYDWEGKETLRVLAHHFAGEVHKAQLLSAQVNAKEDEAFRTFSTFLLHDLKNFASTLSLIARNAVKHERNPEFRRDAFQSVMDTAEKMKRLCNSLGTFSSQLAAHQAPGNLNQIVTRVVDEQNAALAARVRLDLVEVEDVMLDSDQIARVIQNLLLNASEAIAADGKITVRTQSVDGAVELRVSDDGVGIPREFLESGLFIPFRTTKSTGMGIGLFQCKKILDAHGGTIHIDSVEGHGTTVTLRFPCLAFADSQPGLTQPSST